MIEILVVIAVIALLTVMIIPNFLEIRKRARDIQRKSDVRAIQKALELYKEDSVTHVYPTEVSGVYPTGTKLGTACGAAWSTFILKMPCDPGIAGTAQPYYYKKDGDQEYTLFACIENQSDQDAEDVAEELCTYGKRFKLNQP